MDKNDYDYHYFSGKKFDLTYVSASEFCGLGNNLSAEKVFEHILNSSNRKHGGEFNVFYEQDLVLRVANSVWVFGLGNTACERSFIYALRRAIQVCRQFHEVEVLNHVI